MKVNETYTNNNLGENSVEIVALLKKIWASKKFLSKITTIFFFIGCLIAILSPVVYTSQTTFVPQVSDEQASSSTNSLGALASSLAGIKLNSNEVTSDSYLSPLLYSKITESEEFSLSLLSEELINSKAKKFTVKEYLLSKESIFNFNLIGFIKKYSIGLFISKESNEAHSDVLKKYNFINMEDYNLINSFKLKFSISLNEKEGFINVSATDEDAFISTQLVELVTKTLQKKIIELRTNKVRERLQYSREQYELKQGEFDLLQKELAEFKDSNKNISTASFRSQLQKLESEYQLQENILINLASEYNNNKIKLNKDTPIFSVIDEVSVPNKRSKPMRSLLIIIYTFIGFILSVSFVLAKKPLLNLIKKIKD